MGEKAPINHLAAQGSTWRMVMYLKLVSVNALVVFNLLDGGIVTIYFLTSAVLKIWDQSIGQSSQVPLPADMGYSTDTQCLRPESILGALVLMKPFRHDFQLF